MRKTITIDLPDSLTIGQLRQAGEAIIARSADHIDWDLLRNRLPGSIDNVGIVLLKVGAALTEI